MNKYFEKVRDMYEDSLCQEFLIQFSKYFALGGMELAMIGSGILALQAFAAKKYLLGIGMVINAGYYKCLEKEYIDEVEI